MRISFLFSIVVILVSAIFLVTDKTTSGYIGDGFLQFVDQRYPVQATTGETASINGTIVSLISKNMTVSLDLRSNGTQGVDWDLLGIEPSNTVLLPSENSMHYEFKIQLLKHGTFFFQPLANILEIQNASLPSVKCETCTGEVSVITIEGNDLNSSTTEFMVYTAIGLALAVLAAVIIIYRNKLRTIKR